MLVKFKLEVGIDTQRLQEIGEASRLTSKADLLIANTLEMVGGTNPGAWILGEDAPRWTTRRDLARAVSVAVMARICPETKSVAPREQAPALAVCLARHCRAMIALIRSVPPAIYSDKENGSSFGEHVRHGLDHLHAVLRGAIDGSVDYEQRRRGWIGEREPAPALAELAAAAEHLERLQAADLTRPVVVHCLIDPQAAPISLASTLARELLFALSHETHHAAILSRLLAAYNITVPENFSLAPSTVAWRASTCVASV